MIYPIYYNCSYSIYHNFGGICAYISSEGKVQNCKNKVNILVKAPHKSNDICTYVGGISGTSLGAIENCSNYAEISATITSNADQWDSAVVAGIVADGEGSVNKCLNTGKITSENKTATNQYIRAFGIANTDTYNCYNSGEITATDSFGWAIACGISLYSSSFNCYNIGKVNAKTDKYAISNTQSNLNCYYLEGTGVDSTGATSLTEAQMKLQAMYSGWDFDTVWTMEGRADYPYPELRDVPLVLPEDLTHKHEYTSEVTKEATHLEEGVTTYTCACGDSYTEAIAKLEGHTYKAVVTEPTCTAKGYTTYTCECGDTYVDDYTEELDHEYTSEITTPATHLTEGVKTFTCACGDSYTEPVAKLEDHTYTSEVTKEATHLEEGETTYTCACGDTYTEAIAKLEGHTYKAVVIEPTCTTKGYTTYTCECGDSYVDNYIGMSQHTYSSKITKYATHLSEGAMTYTCSSCGYSYNAPIAKTPDHAYTHSYVVAPNCKEEGYTVYTCDCGDEYKDNFVEKTSHIYYRPSSDGIIPMV